MLGAAVDVVRRAQRREAAQARHGGSLGQGAFLDYCRRRSIPKWQEGPQHALICQTLQDAVIAASQGRGEKHMIFEPPRHGKSHTTSVLLPTWTLGTFSSFTVILTMYGGKIATAKGREARNLLRDVGPDEFGVEVSEASAAVGDWSLHKRRGRMISVGFGGPLTGEGGQLLICDDPFKNAEEANSALIREAKWDWWRTVFETRADFPSATIILLMTRWHEDDLAGRLLKEQGDAREGGEWHVLSLPAESLGPKVDPLKRPLHAPLWPDRWPTRILAKRKEALGPYYWAALYQQSPMPEGGAVFRRSTFQYFFEEHTARGDFYVLLRRTGERGELQEIRVRCEDCWGFCTLDPAFTAKESSDFFAMGHWLVTPAIAGVRYRLLNDVLHTHLEVPDQLPRIESWGKQHDARFVGIEESVGSLGVIQQAERDGRIVIRRCKVDRDKQARSAPLAGRYEAGQVFHRQGADWLEDYERELVEFPRGAHDDLVDMAGHAELLLLSFDTLDDISPVSLEQIAPFNLDGPSGRRWE